MVDLLFETRKFGAKSCSSPMTQNLYLTKKGELFGDPKRYRRLIKKQNDFIITCRGIPHSIIIVTQYMSSLIIDY